MTLLERWDQYMNDGGIGPRNDELRRAIAIAQAVEESANEIAFDTAFILRRADELLEGKK